MFDWVVSLSPGKERLNSFSDLLLFPFSSLEDTIHKRLGDDLDGSPAVCRTAHLSESQEDEFCELTELEKSRNHSAGVGRICLPKVPIWFLDNPSVGSSEKQANNL